MASIEWLEQELSTIDAAVILVAHDRWFLESVATSVLELEDGRSTFFPGKWHVWRQEKAARLANQAKWADGPKTSRGWSDSSRASGSERSRARPGELKRIARIEAVRVRRRAAWHTRLRVPEARGVGVW
jgi:ATP-binding cassette subfamily F protein 3